MTKLRVGIVGAGGIAQSVHIPAYLKLTYSVDLVAVADVVKPKAQQCAEKFGIPHVYENYQTMIAEMNLDAISVCVPNKFHAEVVQFALQNGCHVLCEKPPALNANEAQAMAHLAEVTGRILTYGFHYRYSPEAMTLKKFLQAGQLGRIYAAKATAVRRRGIPGWGVFTNKELQGGGPLIDIGVHMLDLALYLMDFPEPDVVLGITHREIGNRPGVGLMGDWDWEHYSIEDMARGLIRFKNGHSLSIEAAFAVNVEKTETFQVSLMGTKGGADVFPLRLYSEQHDVLLDTHIVHLPKREYHFTEIESFVRACLGGDMPLSTPMQGVYVQRIVDALYESAARGQAIKLDNHDL
jgi:predicted dehydrogenase